MRMHRKVCGLMEAARTTAPARTPSRLTGSRAAGMSYQKKVGKQLTEFAIGQELKLESGPWFSFTDANGRGLCQPDFLLHFPEHTLIIECKLTARMEGWWQMEELYAPVISKALARPIGLLQVAKNLSRALGPHQLYDNLWDAAKVRSGRHLWHTLGTGSPSWFHPTGQLIALAG